MANIFKKEEFNTSQGTSVHYDLFDFMARVRSEISHATSWESEEIIKLYDIMLEKQHSITKVHISTSCLIYDLCKRLVGSIRIRETTAAKALWNSILELRKTKNIDDIFIIIEKYVRYAFYVIACAESLWGRTYNNYTIDRVGWENDGTGIKITLQDKTGIQVCEKSLTVDHLDFETFIQSDLYIDDLNDCHIYMLSDDLAYRLAHSFKIAIKELNKNLLLQLTSN